MATTITGLTRLQRKLDSLPRLALAEIRKKMEQGADEIVGMMKSLVAVDGGALRDSIGWTWGEVPKGAGLVASVKGRGVGGDLTITIYAGNAEAFYARWVEFGTARHINAGKFAGTQHPGTAAQPFFYVSWRANKKNARKRVREGHRAAVKAVMAGG